jgi:hypothetical protein
MTTKAKEIAQGAHLPSCSSMQSCSMRRRDDRVYADQLWELARRLGPGHNVFDPSCP